MRYEIEQRSDGHWWYRCKECGRIAGYATKELCERLAQAHVDQPHPR